MFRGCVALALLAVVVCGAQRSKRQLSPAVGLQDRLSPLLMGAMGYDSPFKRSEVQLKRHISPSFDVEEDMGNMRALMDIGKRQVSVADDVGRHMEMYNRLFAAGKKRAALAPSHDLEMYNRLFTAGKRAALAPSTDLEMYNRLFAAGKKRAALAPSHDLVEQWAINDFLQKAGRK